MKRALSILLVLIVMLVALPVGAQDSDSAASPLHALLALVPASVTDPLDPRFGVGVSYADYRAAEQARPDGPTFDNWAALMAALDTPDSDLWFASWQRIASGDPEFANRAAFDADMIHTYGLDYFEIDRTLAFGRAPEDGVIYGGHFDQDTVIATFTARTYTLTDLDGVPLLCGPVGCENGADFGQWLPDQAEIDPDTLKRSHTYPIFGGKLGRQEPLALLPGLILNSADWDITQGMVAAYNGTTDVLLDVPEYRALADTAVLGNGLLVQMTFITPDEQRYGTYAGDPLPEYDLAALIDRQEGADQVNMVALVYGTEAEADSAAAVLHKRVAEHRYITSFDIDTPIIEQDPIHATLDVPRVVYNDTADRWVVMVTARYPSPSPEPDADGRLVSFGVLYIRWIITYYSGEFTPLWLDG